jgi:putative nucleotidyltransferase with HDIG domain
MAMAAKVLQLVNSAFFAAGQPLTSPFAAALRLGLDTLRSLLEVGTFRPAQPSAVRYLQSLWDHAADTQRNARAIATHEGWTQAAIEEAATAGLLHDIGRLLLTMQYGEAYGDIIADAAQNGTDLGLAEEQGFGASHAAVGASLLGSWGLPETFVTAVGDHQYANVSPSTTLDTGEIVRIADILAHEEDFVDVACALSDDEFELDDAVGRLAVWRAACAA